MLTLKEFAIGNFMYDVYLSLLEKHIYHTYPRIFVEDYDMNLKIFAP